MKLRLVVFAILSAVLGSAQSFVGGVRGLVQDPGGAIIANAKVTLKNEATGLSRTAVSNAAGSTLSRSSRPRRM